MKKQNFDVNNLRVASPCAIGWETMSGDERARYCNSCKLNVYNVSAMTEAEVESLIAKREGRICVRLYRRADGTVLTKDCPIGFRAHQKRAARFAGAALAAILGLFSVSFGQKEDSKSVDASKVKIVRISTPSQESILNGQVLDNMGAVVPGAEIKLTDENKNEFITRSDNEGKFQISKIPARFYTLEVTSSAEFFPFRLAQIEIKNKEQNNFEITLDFNSKVTVISGIAIELPKTNSFNELFKLKSIAAPKKSRKHKTKN